MDESKSIKGMHLSIRPKSDRTCGKLKNYAEEYAVSQYYRTEE